MPGQQPRRRNPNNVRDDSHATQRRRYRRQLLAAVSTAVREKVLRLDSTRRLLQPFATPAENSRTFEENLSAHILLAPREGGIVLFLRRAELAIFFHLSRRGASRAAVDRYRLFAGT